MKNPTLIAFGGLIGVIVRWGLVEADVASMSATVLGLNMIGSLAIGLLAGLGLHQTKAWAFGAVGFCGGLTTFSTFAVEVASRLEGSDVASATGYTLLTAVGAVLCAAFGFGIGSRRQPITDSQAAVS